MGWPSVAPSRTGLRAAARRGKCGARMTKPECNDHASLARRSGQYTLHSRRYTCCDLVPCAVECEQAAAIADMSSPGRYSALGQCSFARAVAASAFQSVSVHHMLASSTFIRLRSCRDRGSLSVQAVIEAGRRCWSRLSFCCSSAMLVTCRAPFHPAFLVSCLTNL